METTMLAVSSVIAFVINSIFFVLIIIRISQLYDKYNSKEIVKTIPEKAVETTNEPKQLQYVYISSQVGITMYFSYKRFKEAIEDFKAILEEANESFDPYRMYPVAKNTPTYLNIIASNIYFGKETGATIVDLGSLKIGKDVRH